MLFEGKEYYFVDKRCWEQSVCSDTNCYAPMTNRWGSAAESTHDRLATRSKREERKYSEV